MEKFKPIAEGLNYTLNYNNGAFAVVTLGDGRVGTISINALPPENKALDESLVDCVDGNDLELAIIMADGMAESELDQ